jgi:DNA-binding transcriptional LysR family regulator
MPKAEPHLKLRQIEVFLAAARLGNFTEAAKALGISSAAMSQAVVDLERELGGVVLFNRDQNGARLTAQGEALVEPATRLLQTADAVRKAVKPLVSVSETLRIAYLDVAARIVRESVESLMRKRPSLSVEARECDEDDIAGAVAADEIDIGISYVSKSIPVKDLTIVDTVTKVCIVSLRHPRARDERINIADLMDEPLALPWLPSHQSSTGRIIQEYFETQAFTPGRIVYRGNTIASVVEVVRAGFAVGVIPRTLRGKLEGVATLHFIAENTSDTEVLGVVQRPGHELTPAAKALAIDLQKRALVGERDWSNG